MGILICRARSAVATSNCRSYINLQAICSNYQLFRVVYKIRLHLQWPTFRLHKDVQHTRKASRSSSLGESEQIDVITERPKEARGRVCHGPRKKVGLGLRSQGYSYNNLGTSLGAIQVY